MTRQHRIFKLSVEDWSLITRDLAQARTFLLILKKNNDADYDSTVIRRALTLAGIVAYCRPFKTSRDADNKRKTWVPDELVDDLPEEMSNLHGELITSRDREWAHTDWVSHAPKVSQIESGYEIRSENIWLPLDPSSIHF